MGWVFGEFEEGDEGGGGRGEVCLVWDERSMWADFWLWFLTFKLIEGRMCESCGVWACMILEVFAMGFGFEIKFPQIGTIVVVNEWSLVERGNTRCVDDLEFGLYGP